MREDYGSNTEQDAARWAHAHAEPDPVDRSEAAEEDVVERSIPCPHGCEVGFWTLARRTEIGETAYGRHLREVHGG